MSDHGSSLHTPGHVAARAIGLLVLWLVLAGASPADLPAGIVAAALATWASVGLLPPGRWRFRPIALARLALRFLYQSIVAGIDVAWRALDPRLPLRPGFVVYQPRLPPGLMRSTFCTITSLLPGTVPAGNDGGHLVYHCLDVDQPIVSQLAAEEAALSQAVRDD